MLCPALSQALKEDSQTVPGSLERGLHLLCARITSREGGVQEGGGGRRRD